MEPVPKILIWRRSSTKNDSWSYRCFPNINTQLVSHFSSFKSFWAELRFFFFNASYTTPKWVLPLELCSWINHLTLNKVSCHLHHASYRCIRFYIDVFPLLANALESDRGCSLQGEADPLMWWKLLCLCVIDHLQNEGKHHAYCSYFWMS